MKRSTVLMMVGLVAVGLVAGALVFIRDRPAEGPQAMVYLLPDDLPSGWAVGHGTLRVGHPGDQDGTPIDVSDYTVVWRPKELAGASRSDSTSVDDGSPAIFLNSGSAFYNGLVEMSGEELVPLEDAKVRSSGGDTFELTFPVGCCAVSLGSTGVGEDELRRVAEGLQRLDEGTWRDTLGNRLLVDEDEP